MNIEDEDEDDVQMGRAAAFDLDGVRWTWLQDHLLLLALPRGELVEVRVDYPEGRETKLRGRLVR